MLKGQSKCSTEACRCLHGPLRIYKTIEARLSRYYDKIFAHRISEEIGFKRCQDLAEVAEDLKAKAARDEVWFCIDVHGKSLRLSQNPLFMIRDDIKGTRDLRAFAVWLAEWPWFERLIIFVILANLLSWSIQHLTTQAKLNNLKEMLS
jgi:hypothetical protein